MWKRVKKVIGYVFFPILFLLGLIIGRSHRNADRGSAEKIGGDIERAEELARGAEGELAELRNSLSELGDGTGDSIERVENAVSRAGDFLESIERARDEVDRCREEGERIGRINKQLDELDEESWLIVGELYRRAVKAGVITEDPEYGSLDPMHSERGSGDNSPGDQIEGGE